MRLFMTEEMRRVSDVLIPYMQYSQEKGWHLKSDVPEDIKKLRETDRALWNELTETYYAHDCMQYMRYTDGKGWVLRSDAPKKIKNLHRTLQELLEKIQNNTILESGKM